MRKVQIGIELDEEDYHSFETEAQRVGTTVEALVERVLRGLYRDLKHERQEGNHPIIFP
jgi:hypothetical protein